MTWCLFLMVHKVHLYFAAQNPDLLTTNGKRHFCFCSVRENFQGYQRCPQREVKIWFICIKYKETENIWQIIEQMLGVLSVEWMNMWIDEITFAVPYWINSHRGLFTHDLCKSSQFRLVDISSNLGSFDKGGN